MSKSDPEFTLSVFCNFSKVFDVKDPEILLTKMNNSGIHGIVHDWFENDLSDRQQQFVEVGGKVPDRVTIKIGVP